MRKTMVFLATCLFFSVCINTFSLAGDFYVGGNVDLVFLSEADFKNAGVTQEATFDAGFGVGGCAGYDFGFARAEGEVVYRKNNVNKVTTLEFGKVSPSGDISALSFMLNGFYDFKNQTRITPYIGAGIGVARVDLSTVSGGGIRISGGDDIVFAYQFEVGFGNRVNESITLDLGYRYFATTDPQLGDTDAEYHSHNFLASIRYAF